MTIALIGEAWSEADERARAPFSGPAGFYLNQWLEAVGISRVDCFTTSVFNLRAPPDLSTLCGSKKEVTHDLGPLASGKYVHDRFLGQVERLQREIDDLRPSLIIALGGAAAWACHGDGRISAVRGTVSIASRLQGIKCLATYNPGNVLRDWSLRPVVIMDLAKAERESHFPELRRPVRYVHIEPSLADIAEFFETKILPAEYVAVDIETAGTQITCIGFAPNDREALVIPFTDPRKADANYWPSCGEELAAWGLVKKICACPVRKVLQNGLYDTQFLWRSYGIKTVNWTDDTMLLHHALFPELEKGLAFMGSVYTNEPAWKLQHRESVMTIKSGD